jgi:hypothetical protein
MTQPLAPILPSAPEVSLVTSARQMDGLNEDAWVRGVSFSGDLFCMDVGGWERCVDEADTIDGSYTDGSGAPSTFKPWTVYAAWECTSAAPEAYRDAIRAARATLDAKLPHAVARELWTGATSGSLSLQSTAVDVTGGGGAIDAVTTAQTLIANFEDCVQGAQAFLHVPSVLMEQLYDHTYVTRVGARLLTPTGHVVVPGPGYPNAPGAWGPEASGGPIEVAAGEAAMYVTGPVELAFSDVDEDQSHATRDVIPGATFGRLNRSAIYVHRDALFRFPPCCVFGAVATRSA